MQCGSLCAMKDGCDTVEWKSGSCTLYSLTKFVVANDPNVEQIELYSSSLPVIAKGNQGVSKYPK